MILQKSFVKNKPDSRCIIEAKKRYMSPDSRPYLTLYDIRNVHASTKKTFRIT